MVMTFLAASGLLREMNTCSGARARWNSRCFSRRELADRVAVKIGPVDDADFGLHVGDLVDDVARAGLADGELVFVGLDGVDHLHERLDGEHVVLGGDLAQLLARFWHV